MMVIINGLDGQCSTIILIDTIYNITIDDGVWNFRNKKKKKNVLSCCFIKIIGSINSRRTGISHRNSAWEISIRFQSLFYNIVNIEK